jgi:hypothetical protein
MTRMAICGAVALGVLGAGSTPALAASNSCTVQPRRSYCSAGDTSANAQHEVFVQVTNSSRAYRLQVRDVANGRIVFDKEYTTDAWRRLSYVYSTYEAEIFCHANCPGTVVRIFN